MRRAAACASVALVITLVIASSACTEDHPNCYQGDYKDCVCDTADGGEAGDAGAGKPGLQACLPSGDGYGVCVCDGKIPGISGDGGGEGGGGG